jgi:hypothetical protein
LTSSMSKPRRTMANEWRAMSPVETRAEEMGERPSGMGKDYGAAWAGTRDWWARAPEALQYPQRLVEGGDGVDVQLRRVLGEAALYSWGGTKKTVAPARSTAIVFWATPPTSPTSPWGRWCPVPPPCASR